MRASVKPRLLALLRTLLGLGIVAWLAWSLLGQLRAARVPVLAATPAELLLALGSGALALLALAFLFGRQLQLVGFYRAEHRLYYFRLWLQAYFYRYVPGKVMLLHERVRLGEAAGVPAATSLLLVFWETLLLLAGAGLVAAAGVGLVQLQAGLTTGSLLGAGLVLVLALLAFVPVVRLLAARVPWLATRVGGFLKVPLRSQLGLVLGYAGVWALFGASFAWTCRCFAAGDAAGLSTALWFVIAYVAGLVVAVAPAGVGVREGVLVAGLAPVHGMDAALAFALASRVLMTLVELSLVGGSLLIPLPRPQHPSPPS